MLKLAPDPQFYDSILPLMAEAKSHASVKIQQATGASDIGMDDSDDDTSL